MSESDLIPIKKGQTDIPRLGGLAKSEQKTLALNTVTSGLAKCKHCKAKSCPLKKSNLKQDKEMLCSVPEARARAIYFDKPVMNLEILEKYSEETLLKLQRLCTSDKALKILHDAMINERKLRQPQVNVNLNASEDAAKQIITALFARREK